MELERTSSTPDLKSIVDWYREKTASVVEKYGPGPRIHFHVGFFDRPVMSLGRNVEECRRILVASQEVLLRRAAEIWDAPRCLSGDVLDVGCGLGGGSLFWAEEYKASVTAVTIVPEHAQLVASFAKQAGVTTRVRPVLADACAIKSHVRFDAAVAIESACYLPRKRWFQHISGLLRDDAHVCIEDSFIVDPRWAAPFDTYWRTRIGTLDEYVRAAREAGFTLDRDVDITDHVTEFWRQSIAYTELVRAARRQSAVEEERLVRSIVWQSSCLQAWREGGISTRFLRFHRVKL